MSTLYLKYELQNLQTGVWEIYTIGIVWCQETSLHAIVMGGEKPIPEKGNKLELGQRARKIQVGPGLQVSN